MNKLQATLDEFTKKFTSEDFAPNGAKYRRVSGKYKDHIGFLSKALAEYARSVVPPVSDISKHKTEVGKQFPETSYIEENGWNSAVAEMTYRIDQDFNQLKNE